MEQLITTLATPGGTFAFADPQPTDGAVIDSTTGEELPVQVYYYYLRLIRLRYTTTGPCPTTGEIASVTALDGDDNFF